MKTKLDQILRVDHAGEIGASKIYEGQIKILGNTEIGPLLQKMKDQEQEHLDTFHQLLNDHKVRPTALMPIWNAAGFVLGAFTASLGKDAAMACTIAVEEVIGKHYEKQAEQLRNRLYCKLIVLHQKLCGLPQRPIAQLGVDFLNLGMFHLKF